MGLDLVGYVEKSEPYWSMSYSTFDGMRQIHKDAVEEALKDDKFLYVKLNEKIKETTGYDALSIEETMAAFYDHSDCDGSWNREEIKSLLCYLNETFNIYEKYVEKIYDERQWIAPMKGLIECLDAFDYIEFA